MADESLIRFRRVVAASLAELESRRSEVNDLNVFPVADGDTGDNMAMTMRAVMDELNVLNGQPLDEVGREEVVSAVARAALLGARGNSGVILSQIVRGAAEELASRPGELVDPVLVAAAFARAADAAYDSVRNPAEGTMLSAVRAMAHRVAHDIAHMDKVRLGPDATAEEQDALIAEVLERALESAQEAVERGPDQLAVLKEAGVVDAGAYGLTVIVAGVVAALRGQQQIELAHQEPARVVHATQHESSTYRYCTNFAVTGVELDSQSFVAALERIGDSVLVVGDERALRVHVHTDSPDDAVALFAEHGDVSRLEASDMREQVADRNARLAQSQEAACAVVAVATGDGMHELYAELGVEVLEGGPTMNPSTAELLAAIDAAHGREVLLLPNSPNVIMAAEEAAKLAERPVRVIPTRAPQEGLAALLAFDPGQDVATNAEAVAAASEAVAVGGVAEAAKDDPDGRFSVGDAVGYRGEELVAWGDPAETLRATLASLADGAELVTCIAGADAPLDEEAVAATVPGGVELDFHRGGQPAWWWLLCAE
ncbi:MAG TPA: DAK2 domain-containing protein [Thermoleophilaceae bacterium]|nr:DAK2 domain-containing protein [Thermoleophilaceae bacterium]